MTLIIQALTVSSNDYLTNCMFLYYINNHLD